MRALEAKASSAVEARREKGTAASLSAYGDDTSDEEPMDTMQHSKSLRTASSSDFAAQPPPSRLFPTTLHTLELPLPSGEVKALLQYFHTLSLSTSLQRSLPILLSLLSFTKTFESAFTSLRTLVIHALHESLTSETAAKIYEGALLGGSIPLQLRAMQVMLSVRLLFSSTFPPTEIGC
jgi:hypothetical protein